MYIIIDHSTKPVLGDHFSPVPKMVAYEDRQTVVCFPMFVNSLDHPLRVKPKSSGTAQ
jgi:hypothetical protein